jgi:outer membrane immunogenic protein
VVCGSNVSSSNHNVDVVRLGVNYGTSALAADMPGEAPPAAEPVPNWTGFYIGTNGGYGWSKDSTTAAPFQNIPPIFGKTLIPFFTLSNPVNGAVFGGQLGYNYQIAPTWVIGVEGDFDGTGLNGASQSIVPEPFGVRTRGVSNGFSAREKVEWLASVRARLGYAWGPSLFYVTGGGAWERVSDNFLLSTSFAGLGASGSSSAGSATATLSGYAVGGGYEWKINPNWTVRAEYLHYGFSGSSNTSIFATCTGAVCGSNVSSSNHNVDVVRLAVNYMW